MIRVFLLLMVAFALPFIVNWIWTQMRADSDGLARQYLALAGLILAVVGMFALVFFETGSSSYDGVYHPPVLEDGEVRPGRFGDPDSGAELLTRED